MAERSKSREESNQSMIELIRAHTREHWCDISYGFSGQHPFDGGGQRVRYSESAHPSQHAFYVAGGCLRWNIRSISLHHSGWISTASVSRHCAGCWALVLQKQSSCPNLCTRCVQLCPVLQYFALVTRISVRGSQHQITAVFLALVLGVSINQLRRKSSIESFNSV